jgi:transposase
VLAAHKLHADDTPVPVLEPGRGETKTGRLWTYVRDDRPAGSAEAAAVWFQYSPDRKGEFTDEINPPLLSHKKR